MGKLIQSLELTDDVTINASTVIARMQVRAKAQEKFLILYSGLVKIADTSARGVLGVTETNGGSSTNCQKSNANTGDFQTLAGGFVQSVDEDFEVRLDALTIS